MNNRIFGKKLSRGRPAREALFASLIRAFVLSGKIETTKAKAKAIQSDLEKIVSLAKKGTLSSRRQILANLDNAKDATEAIFVKVGRSFSKRSSGFTKIVNIGSRKGDNSPMVRIEWTENENVSTKTKGS